MSRAKFVAVALREPRSFAQRMEQEAFWSKFSATGPLPRPDSASVSPLVAAVAMHDLAKARYYSPKRAGYTFAMESAGWFELLRLGHDIRSLEAIGRTSHDSGEQK